MMKLLLVVLSMLYGGNTQTAETVSGCNSDIIELFSQKRTISLFNLFPRAYFAAATPFLTVGYDSSKIFTGFVENGKSYVTLIQCNQGEVTTKTLIEYTQETETRLQGVGFPTPNSTLDYFPVECTDGLFALYVCDPSQVKGSGTETFVLGTRTNVPVSTEALESCKARLQEVYADVELTPLTVGAC